MLGTFLLCDECAFWGVFFFPSPVRAVRAKPMMVASSMVHVFINVFSPTNATALRLGVCSAYAALIGMQLHNLTGHFNQRCLSEFPEGFFSSAQVTLNGGLVREFPQYALNSGLGIILICPDILSQGLNTFIYIGDGHPTLNDGNPYRYC